ncbi:MAG: hypothetical protein AAGK37_12835 [Pseudomonadota bacterium]
MSQISRLHYAEPAQVDRLRLEELVYDHGPQGAERLMGRTLEDLAVRLNQAERAWRKGHSAALQRDANSLADLAYGVGLVGLCQVANAVAEIAVTDDSAALGATVARMMRVGEASLMSAWDLDGQTL